MQHRIVFMRKKKGFSLKVPTKAFLQVAKVYKTDLLGRLC